MGDGTGKYVLLALVLPLLLWVITKPASNFGHGAWQEMGWLRPVSWIAAGLGLYWLINTVILPMFFY